jgi:hypothetical protein
MVDKKKKGKTLPVDVSAILSRASPMVPLIILFRFAAGI